MRKIVALLAALLIAAPQALAQTAPTTSGTKYVRGALPNNCAGNTEPCLYSPSSGPNASAPVWVLNGVQVALYPGGGSNNGLEGAYGTALSSANNVVTETAGLGAIKFRDASPSNGAFVSFESNTGTDTYFQVRPFEFDIIASVLDFTDDSGAAVAPLHHGRIRYNKETNVFEQSLSTGAWSAIAGSVNVTGPITGTGTGGSPLDCPTCVVTSGSYANPSWLTTLAASKLTGQVAVANGGTGLSSAGGVANRAVYTADGSTFTVGLLPNAALANSSVTINTGSGLGGGASVALGGSLSLTATASGDVTGALNATTVAKLQGRTLASTAPSDTQTVCWSAGSSQWQPCNATTGTVTSISQAAGIVATPNPITSTGTIGVDQAWNGPVWTGAHAWGADGQGNTKTARITLQNLTAASALANMQSPPMLEFRGGMWNGASSIDSRMALYEAPGSTSASLFFLNNIDGAGYSTTANNAVALRIVSDGRIIAGPNQTLSIQGRSTDAMVTVDDTNGQGITATTASNGNGFRVVNNALSVIPLIAGISLGTAAAPWGDLQTAAATVGDGTAGAKTVKFKNSAGTGTFSWTVTANRTITVPDTTDTLVVQARQILTDATLTGGGSLAADRTLGVVFGSGANSSTQGNDARLPPAPATLGNLIYDSGSAYVALADVAAGRFLRSGGVAAAPAWSTLILPNAATQGDLMYASASNQIGLLADVATGQVLHSGGIGASPSYAAVNVASEVTGVLPIANGGTNSGTALSGTTIMIASGGAIVQGATGTTSTVLHGNVSGAPTYAAVNAATEVTGVLPIANGGTGSSSQIFLTSVGATAPIASSGGLTPTISINTGSGITTSGGNLVVDQGFSPTWTGSHTFNNVIVASTAPTLGSHLANKAYVDSVASGLNFKDSVYASTASNVASLVGGITMDGVVVPTGSRVLLRGQSTATQNGIWVTAAVLVAWSRPADFATGSSAATSFTFVENGTTYADTGWVCTNASGSDVVDTNNLTFAQFSGAGTYSAGTGLMLTGTTFAADFGTASGKVTQGNDSRLNATPSGNGKLPYDTGSGYGETAVGTTSQVLHGATGAPTWGAVSLTAEVSGTLPLANGGIGATTLNGANILNGAPSATGDLVYSTSGTQAMTALADVTAGSYLRSGGAAAAPVWSTLTLPNAATTGDVLAATASNGIGRIAAVAANQFFQSAGSSTLPAWVATPVFGAGATASGSTSFDLSGSSGTWKPPTGGLATNLVFSSDNADAIGSTSVRASSVTAKLHTSYFAAGDAILNTVTNGLDLTNANTSTASGDANQAYSGAIHQQGAGRKTNATAASQTVENTIVLRPVSGATAPTMQVVQYSNLAGAGNIEYMGWEPTSYTTGGFTLTSVGNATATFISNATMNGTATGFKFQPLTGTSGDSMFTIQESGATNPTVKVQSNVVTQANGHLIVTANWGASTNLGQFVAKSTSTNGPAYCWDGTSASVGKHCAIATSLNSVNAIGFYDDTNAAHKYAFDWNGLITVRASTSTSGLAFSANASSIATIYMADSAADTANAGLALKGGAAGAASANNALTAGPISITGGIGGAATTTKTASAGASGSVIGGLGGTGAASGNGPGKGGNGVVLSGAGGALTSGFSGANSGDATIDVGAKTGTGVNGDVKIGTGTNAPTHITIGQAGTNINAGDATVSQATNVNTNVTANGSSVVITTQSASTAANSAETGFTLSNSSIVSGSAVICRTSDYSGTFHTNGQPDVTYDTIAAGSVKIHIVNRDGTNALSGTMKIHCLAF